MPSAVAAQVQGAPQTARIERYCLSLKWGEDRITELRRTDMPLLVRDFNIHPGGIIGSCL